MNLLKSMSVVSLITMFSRFLGFARDSIIARIFGSGMEIDAFFLAFKLPNLLRRIFADGAFSQAFIPILIEYNSVHNKESTKTLISHISGLLMLILTTIVILGIISSPWILRVVAPGFSEITEKIKLTTKLLHITFPYILLISLSSLAGAILNTWNYFSIPAFSSSFLNISIISFAIFIAPNFNPPILSLAWAVIIGGIVQLIYQLLFLKKIGMLVFPSINFYNKNVMQIVKKMIPAILGVSVSQISAIINTIFISFLVSGSISWMYYADRLIEFPSGVLGVALGTILLPLLSRSVSSGNNNEYFYLIDKGLRVCFLLSFPSAVGIGILAKPLVISLFQYGKFTAFDSLMTQHALIGYSVGIIGTIMIKVLAIGFYSKKDIKTPVKIAIITLIFTQLMNLAFINYLKHAGLSLSIGIASCLNAILLYLQLRKKHGFIPQPRWLNFFLRLLISVIIMGIILIGMIKIMPEWSFGTMPNRILRLMAVVIVGFITYFTTLTLLGFRAKNL